MSISRSVQKNIIYEFILTSSAVASMFCQTWTVWEVSDCKATVLWVNEMGVTIRRAYYFVFFVKHHHSSNSFFGETICQ